MLVTGGINGITGFDTLASTEVYRPSTGEWREVPGGALPRPMTGVRVVTLNNRVLLFGEEIILISCSLIARAYVGGKDNDRNEHAEILEYSDSEGKWISVGELSKKRGAPAVSIIDFDNFKSYCRF